MLKKLFNWLIERWFAGFSTAAFFFMLKLYIDLPEEKKANFFQFEWLKSILQTEIVLWKVIVFIAFVVIVFWIRNRWKKTKENSGLDFFIRPNNPLYNYRVDIFGINNAKWTWDYEWNPYQMSNLVKDVFPLCPVCDSKMEFERYSSYDLTCARCRLEGSQYHHRVQQLESDVTKEIIRRINTDEWKTRKSS